MNAKGTAAFSGPFGRGGEATQSAHNMQLQCTVGPSPSRCQGAGGEIRTPRAPESAPNGTDRRDHGDSLGLARSWIKLAHRPVARQSARIDASGSTRDARRAGIETASNAVPTTIATTAA